MQLVYYIGWLFPQHQRFPFTTRPLCSHNIPCCIWHFHFYYFNQRWITRFIHMYNPSYASSAFVQRAKINMFNDTDNQMRKQINDSIWIIPRLCCIRCIIDLCQMTNVFATFSFAHFCKNNKQCRSMKHSPQIHKMCLSRSHTISLSSSCEKWFLFFFSQKRSGLGKSFVFFLRLSIIESERNK